jgi:hypothetical protein
MSDRSEFLIAQQLLLVGYLLDQAEQGLPLPADSSAPNEVSLPLVALASGLPPAAMMTRLNRNLIERWSDTLGVRPISRCER